MSKRLGRLNRGLGGGFVMHALEMRESPAWRALSANARLVLDRLEVELMRHGGFENGNLAVPYSDFVKAGMRRNSIAPAIRQLVALGFVEVRQGKRALSHYRASSLYRLTHVLSRQIGAKHNTEPTDEWRKLRTDEDAQNALAMAATTKNHATQPLPKNKKPAAKTIPHIVSFSLPTSQKAGGENDTDLAISRRR